MNANPNSASRPKILVVDDDQGITTLVAEVLASAGMDAAACHSGYDALDVFAKEPFDLVLIDIMMPGMDGFELCANLRQVTDAPIVFLTAKDGESDLVVGLSLGADDYIVKPFRPRELVARIRARLRTPSAGAFEPSDVVVTRDFDINRRTHEAMLHGCRLDLTPKEFAVLLHLAERAGEPVSARDLYERAWGETYDASAGNTVMVHIRHLRKKCADVDSSQTFIDTVWGVGYRLHGPQRSTA
ncbi:Alkaline phosphatase synthesis transcriptional regulatory protein phoP [Slackia heliotrinireducens]|uniref:Response regulator with CheY-like receiver domain and winged-helix DNA-binding domain n=1 Tax=Slackia heliotrinireducens (strain ATCC 29202 / DSM 20476 / NCTC 11029 / RHS 1) TaxID=471855 RepID=C7N3P1_SLAHD|nr:response regulator transcription factor [Slackia heliotrinireducens]ACV21632.1 response regulator with CheY-like receiver domain and winged-helix DNA-binding domain [Slackia heliotrinireducens DSM 20476]VEG99206.1 Alkaline phosphatase synthesis transcriptional regulatory protein phoP [Slackia heliotrinireducens]